MRFFLFIAITTMMSFQTMAITTNMIKEGDILTIYTETTDKEITIYDRVIHETIRKQLRYLFVGEDKSLIIAKPRLGQELLVLTTIKTESNKIWAHVQTDESLKGWLLIGSDGKNHRDDIINTSYIENNKNKEETKD